MKPVLNEVKVIVFDTFGTVVDWRGSLVRDLHAWGSQQGVDADWARLADLWRGRYEPQKSRVRDGEIPWTNLDDLHLEALRQLLPELGLAGLSETQIQHINRVWHRLDAWPDAVSGLRRLKKKYVIGPLSNANIALLVNMAKHAGLDWDSIFSSEHFQHYKPHPQTYLGVCRQMYLKPHQVMLCAAHNYDLKAASELGLRTAFVVRPTEYGPAQTTDLTATGAWDVVTDSLEGLAAELDA